MAKEHIKSAKDILCSMCLAFLIEVVCGIEHVRSAEDPEQRFKVFAVFVFSHLYLRLVTEDL